MTASPGFSWHVPRKSRGIASPWISIEEPTRRGEQPEGGSPLLGIVIAALLGLLTPHGPLFIMEKRGEGYDRTHENWHYAVVNPNGAVSLSGSGHERSPTRFCSACHAMAKANDYVFGNGTMMSVRPTTAPKM